MAAAASAAAAAAATALLAAAVGGGGGAPARRSPAAATAATAVPGRRAAAPTPTTTTTPAATEEEEGGETAGPRVLLPGDYLTGDEVAACLAHAARAGASTSATTSSASATTVRLGAGLAAEGEGVRVTKAGALVVKAPNRLYIAPGGRRYVPAVGDAVIGIVADRAADWYRLRINGTCAAMLPALAFDGASKRNRPNIPVGAAVYARVAACSKFMDTELTCQGTFYCCCFVAYPRRRSPTPTLTQTHAHVQWVADPRRIGRRASACMASCMAARSSRCRCPSSAGTQL